MIWSPKWTYKVMVPGTDENKNEDGTNKKKKMKMKTLLLGRVANSTPGNLRNVGGGSYSSFPCATR